MKDGVRRGEKEKKNSNANTRVTCTYVMLEDAVGRGGDASTCAFLNRFVTVGQGAKVEMWKLTFDS